MMTNIEREVMDLSRQLPCMMTSQKFSDVYYDLFAEVEENAEDYLSYNSSYYYDGRWWTGSIEECFFLKHLQKVGNYIVLRVCMMSYYNETAPCIDSNLDIDEDDIDELMEDFNERMSDKQATTEVAQFWFTPDGKMVTLGIARKSENDNSNDDFDGGFDLSSDTHLMPTTDNMFDVLDCNIADYYRDQIEHCVYDEDVCECNAMDVFCEWARQNVVSRDMPVVTRMNDTIAKTLKHWQYDFMYRQFIAKGIEASAYKHYHTIKIARRNGYDVHTNIDQQRWLTLLDTIEFCGGNLQDPRIYAPKDLDEAMAEWTTRANRKRSKEELARQRKEIETAELKLLNNKEQTDLDNADYKKRRQLFLCIVLGNDDIEMSVVQDMKEFCMIGIDQNHCVYNHKYFMFPDALVFKCRCKHTNRIISTVTYDLRAERIVSNLGRHNFVPRQWKEIEDLIIENKYNLRQTYEAQKRLNPDDVSDYWLEMQNREWRWNESHQEQVDEQKQRFILEAI